MPAMKPRKAEKSRAPATTGETAKASATASEGKLPTVSGTGPGEWNDALVAGVVQVCAGSDLGDKRAIGRARAGIAALTGIGPDDVIADMVAAQLVSAHVAAMDCYQRAAGGDLPLEVWREALNQANRLSRTSAALIEALNRHRGKGSQQRVIVEHVNVAAGGQAIVGAVERPGGEGMNSEVWNNPMHAARRCGARTRRGTPCRAPAMPNGRCRMHGGRSPGAPPGNRHAWKHGRYSGEAFRRRREVAELIRTMRALTRQLGT